VGKLCAAGVFTDFASATGYATTNDGCRQSARTTVAFSRMKGGKKSVPVVAETTAAERDQKSEKVRLR
jgi:hypothetical protein